MVKAYVDIWNGLDVLHECYGQTDGRTDGETFP